MTQPPDVRTAPPQQAASGQPPVRSAATYAAAPPTGPSRRTAWNEGVLQLRAAATTEPGQLRIIGAALAALLVIFGAVTAWQVHDRARSADTVVNHSQPLSADAASIYRSLADANTTAASGFLAGGDEAAAVRARYERNIRTASGLLAQAAAKSEGSASAQRDMTILNRELPRYTGLVEAARANNRQGLPLGGAYLRYANDRMHEELLPAAKTLYEAESTQLDEDYDSAKSWPLLALGLGVAGLGALGWAQRRNYQRTNRVFNPGLVAATLATAVTLVWLTAGHGLARSGLGESDEQAQSLHALNQAWIGSLEARGEENMWLVARGAGSTYDQKYGQRMEAVAGGQGDGSGGGQLATALSLADDEKGRSSVRKATDAVEIWRDRHVEARGKEDAGEFDQAVALVIAPKKSTEQAFTWVDSNLQAAREHDQQEFEQTADEGRGALFGLPLGATVLTVLGGAAAVLGIGRRLSEYR